MLAGLIAYGMHMLRFQSLLFSFSYRLQSNDTETDITIQKHIAQLNHSLKCHMHNPFIIKGNYLNIPNVTHRGYEPIISDCPGTAYHYRQQLLLQ